MPAFTARPLTCLAAIVAAALLWVPTLVAPAAAAAPVTIFAIA